MCLRASGHCLLRSVIAATFRNLVPKLKHSCALCTSCCVTFPPGYLCICKQSIKAEVLSKSRAAPRRGRAPFLPMGALTRGWQPFKFWASTFQWTHSRPQGDLKASHRDQDPTAISGASHRHWTGLPVRQALWPTPSQQASVQAVPQEGQPQCPQSAQRGSMFTGALARRPVQGSAFWWQHGSQGTS